MGYIYSIFILVAFAIIKMKFEVIREAKINSMIVELLLLNRAPGYLPCRANLLLPAIALSLPLP